MKNFFTSACVASIFGIFLLLPTTSHALTISDIDVLIGLGVIEADKRDVVISLFEQHGRLEESSGIPIAPLPEPSDFVHRHDDRVYIIDEPFEGSHIIAVYETQESELSLLKKPFVHKKHRAYQNREDLAEKLWMFITDLLPVEYTRSITHLYLMVDDLESIRASVASNEDVSSWALFLDIEDTLTLDGEFIDEEELQFIVMHELAHVISLNNLYIDIDFDISRYDIDSKKYQAKRDECLSVLTKAGCAKSNSYIDSYFSRFWTDDMYNEHYESVLTQEGERQYDRQLERFYRDHEEDFVSVYAATNVAEDFAESFAVYMNLFSLYKQPRRILDRTYGDEGLIGEKVLFFDAYEEFRELMLYAREKAAER